MKYINQVKEFIANYAPDGVATRLKHQKHIWEDIQSFTHQIDAVNNSERIYAYSQGLSESPVCKCGNKVSFVSIVLGYREFCKRNCSYAMSAALERRLQSMHDSGGVGLKNPKSLAKAQKTLQDKHGKEVVNPGQLKSHKARMKTNNPMFVPSVKEKLASTISEKYGANRTNPAHIQLSDGQVLVLSSRDNFENIVKGKSCLQVSKETGLNYTTVLNAAKKYNVLDQMVYNHRSEMEHDMKQWLSWKQIAFKHDDRSVLENGFEIDFLFSDHNFGIELNGLPTHSEVKGGKGSRYHFNKWKECNDKGITLLQFWPDEYWQHKSIVRSKILYLCGLIESKINARNCKIAVLNNTDNERTFLEANHIQGFPSYRQFSLGAYHNDQLVGVMSFANKHNRLELARYATDINTRCVGLFSKMFKHAVKSFGLEGDVYSMSDNRVSNGNLYNSAGWQFVRNVPPSYCYTRDQYTREDKQHFRLEKLARKFGVSQDYVDSHTEWEIMKEMGYDRLWDAGKKLWRITV